MNVILIVVLVLLLVGAFGGVPLGWYGTGHGPYLGGGIGLILLILLILVLAGRL